MIELFKAGGPVMVPLLGCSLLTVAVIFERGWYLWRLERGREAFISRIVATAAGTEGWKGVRLMRIAAEREAAELGRFLGLLSTMVSLAPLLGIFGTVLGIMETFQFLEPSEAAAPLAAKQGLAQALLTTAFGLAIAMVSLIAWKVFQERISGLRHELEIRCSEVEVALGQPPGADEI